MRNQHELPAELRMHIVNTEPRVQRLYCTSTPPKKDKAGVVCSGHFAETATALHLFRAVESSGQAPLLPLGMRPPQLQIFNQIIIYRNTASFQRSEEVVPMFSQVVVQCVRCVRSALPKEFHRKRHSRWDCTESCMRVLPERAAWGAADASSACTRTCLS